MAAGAWATPATGVAEAAGTGGGTTAVAAGMAPATVGLVTPAAVGVGVVAPVVLGVGPSPTWSEAGLGEGQGFRGGSAARLFSSARSKGATAAVVGAGTGVGEGSGEGDGWPATVAGVFAFAACGANGGAAAQVWSTSALMASPCERRDM